MPSVKLRTVIGWMLLVMTVSAFLLGVVWKQYTFVAESRALLRGEQDRERLQNAVMLLETQVRALRRPERLEKLARTRFGLIDPGPPVAVQPEGQVLADGAGPQVAANKNLQAARGPEVFGWRLGGW